MRRMIHREVPSFIGITTILIIAFMVWAIIWLGDREMDQAFRMKSANNMKELYFLNLGELMRSSH